MGIKYSIAEKMDENSAANKICDDMGELNPSLIVFFASSAYEIEKIGTGLKEKTNAKVIGCTTAGELASGFMLKESVVAMGFGEEKISNCSLNTIDMNNININEVIEKVKNDIGTEPKQLETQKYLGLIFTDGTSGKEEEVMDIIGTEFLIPVVGGSAGDDLKFKETYVFDNESAKNNSALLAVIEIPSGFEIIKTQSFSDTGKKLVPTKVDESNRKVIEFDYETALEGYAKAIGISKEEAKESFMTYPVGLMVGEEPFVRSPQRVEEDTMYFYCQIKEGVELSLLKAEDIVESTGNVVKDLEGKAAGIINFNCILRTLELEKKGQTQQYADLFSKIPTIGFSTYGEQYIGHINQTSTMVVFK